MKFKFSLICVMLLLVLSIGVVSAADIDDLNSDVSSSGSLDLTVENDGFDYVSDENIDVNDSSDSQLLGGGTR